MGRKSKLRTAQANNIWSQICWSIALGRISWDNLPKGLTSEQMELFIINGLAVGFRHHVAGNVILPGYWADQLNLYGLPTGYVAFGYNYMSPSFNIDADECAIFYDNPSRRGIASMIDDTAKKLSTIWSTIDINTYQQRIPWMFGGNEDEIASIKAAITNVETNQEVLFVTKELSGLMQEGAKVFPTATPYIANDMFTQLRQTLNTYLTNLGIDNMPVEKKERQLADEVHGNASLVMYNRMAAMRCREQAAEEFNRMFGMSIKPTWRGCTDCDGSVEVSKDDTAI